MPVKLRPGYAYCSVCNAAFLERWVAEHTTDSVHLANVQKLKRSAAYRNRQGDLPFPPTLHDPPKLR
jgi:hypothetical protein